MNRETEEMWWGKAGVIQNRLGGVTKREADVIHLEL